MNLDVFKVADNNNGILIGIRTFPHSKEYQLVKKCRGVAWNPSIKLWTLPYQSENWKELKHQFTNYKFNIHTDNIVQLEDKKSINKHNKQSNKKLNVILNPDQHNALLKLKEQLIIKQYSFHTSKNYLSCFSEFLSFHHQKEVCLITIDDIRIFLLHKIQVDKISESTQNSLINAIKFYYEKVEKRDRFVLYDLRPKPKKQLPGFLSKEDTIKLLQATQNIKHRCILQLIYSSGMRLGELTRMKIRDINFDLNIITIKCAKGKKDRISVLSQKVKILILEYLEIYKPKFYLFEGQTGGKYSDRSVQNILRAAVLKSGVDENTTVHTLRHTFATHMILNGVDLRRVQEYLGHSSLETTAIYTHITDKMKSEIKSPLDDLDI